MLKGPQPVASATSTTPAATPAASPTPGATPSTPTPTGALPAPAATPQAAVLADSDLPPAASDSQLLSFEQFQTKDPFAQQVEAAGSSDEAASGSTEEGPAPAESSSSDETDGPNVDPGTGFDPLGSNPQDQDPNADPPSFTAPDSGSPGTEPGEKNAPEPAAATKISVNGEVESVATKASFPADEPVFQLVSLSRDGKSVRIGVAGGSYASGEPTVKLELGKTLTLQNTADGSRYELKLLTVQGFAPPKRTK